MGNGVRLVRWQVLTGGFRLRFAFRGYTPGCFAKSVESVENARVAEGLIARVWKLLKMNWLREVVVRRDAGLEGVRRKVDRKFGR